MRYACISPRALIHSLLSSALSLTTVHCVLYSVILSNNNSALIYFYSIYSTTNHPLALFNYTVNHSCTLCTHSNNNTHPSQITKEEDFEAILKAEEEHIAKLCSDIIALKPDLVITEKGVSDLASHFFVKAGITGEYLALFIRRGRVFCALLLILPLPSMRLYYSALRDYLTILASAALSFAYSCVSTASARALLPPYYSAAIRRVKKTDNLRIARVSGATIVSRPDELQETDIGTKAGLFDIRKMGEE